MNFYSYRDTRNNKVIIRLETEYGKSDKVNYVNAQCGIPENCPGRIKQKILIEDESKTRITLPGIRLVSFGKAIFWLVTTCLTIVIVILIVIIVNNPNDAPSTNI